ncbi:hypothetical protein Egran_01392 [Elaphomyces granulatus]|uniref:Uncharacterized protein n=1 Tax=Elaphomyces granulatus TaxID=519963 RepID=A0A232M3B1_9EURO|nr:hypothetical protein Egran_01392 [Elaphomyces granulatus]
MTPIIPKKFIFRSVSDHEILPPESLDEWRDFLQCLKQLYFKRQYKKCAILASRILDNNTVMPLHPVHRTFLQFYVAISYEMLGRAAHHYSGNKIPLLRLALDSFIACKIALPPLLPIVGIGPPPEFVSDDDGLSSTSESSEHLSTIDTVTNSITRILERSVESSCITQDDPFLSCESSPEESADSSLKLHLENTSTFGLIPSPLRIRKVRPETCMTSHLAVIETDSFPSLPCRTCSFQSYSKILVNQNGDLPSSGFRSSHSTSISTSSGTSSDMIVSHDHFRSISRYNNDIISFGTQLRSNIDAVSSFIGTVNELQRVHRASKIRRSVSFWSFTPVERESDRQNSDSSINAALGVINSCSIASHGVPMETKQQRINRLRAEGWKTVGLKNKQRGWKGEEYYQRFCSEALHDCYQFG